MMWIQAGLVVLLFLAAVASVWALAQYGPALWEESVEKAKQRRASAVSPTENVSSAVSAYESQVSAVSEFVSPAETVLNEAVAAALARLIIADELDLTVAVKIGAGKKSGEGYQKWSRLIRAAMEEQRENTTPIAGRSTAAKFVSDAPR